MLASFLLGTAMPAEEIESIIRDQFPGVDATAVVLDASGRRGAQTSQ
jgi:hypothetical protein